MLSFVYTVKIAGPAGVGIKSVGQLLSKILIKHGFNVRDYNEYPSLVRGGHNTYQISFSNGDIFAPHYNVDTFFSLKESHWQQHLDEFSKDTLVFIDEDLPQKNKSLAKFFQLPLKALTEVAGSSQSTNIICLGVVSYIYDLDLKVVKGLIETDLKKNIEINNKALELGYSYAKENYSKCQLPLKTVKGNLKNGFFDGNESFGWGFLKGQGNFYAAYPMTPATGVLHFLAQKQEEYKINVIHPEDEIAVSNMAAGAAFAGARAAVGTSGGGFALMTETISFCGVAEIGMVYYLVSRPGPATGLPTWTSQGDLLYSIFSGHGEFPKVVIAPGDHEESFEFGVEALNLAAQLQTPIIVLSDKYLGESSANTSNFSKSKVKVELGKELKKVTDNYNRYSLKTKNGVSSLTVPGTVGGEFLSNSYEHDEYGYSTEDAQMATKMSQKRFLKNKTALNLAPKAVLFGSKNAKKLIIGWGSTKGPILETLKTLKNKDEFAFLQIRTLWPIDPNIKFLIKPFKKVIVVENNDTNQLTTVLKSQLEFNPDQIITKSNGRPFFPEELYEQLK